MLGMEGVAGVAGGAMLLTAVAALRVAMAGAAVGKAGGIAIANGFIADSGTPPGPKLLTPLLAAVLGVAATPLLPVALLLLLLCGAVRSMAATVDKEDRREVW